MKSNANDILTRQFKPFTTRFLFWSSTPIGWLIVAAIGAAGVALTLSPQMWLIFGVLVALIILGVTWPIVAMSTVTCEIRFETKRTTEKKPTTVRLLIKNNLWLPVWGLSLEKGFFRKSTDQQGDPIAIALERISAASTTEFRWEFTPENRGVFPHENPVLSCGFPFGLWYAKKEVKFDQRLIVWPEVYRLGSLPPVAGRQQLMSENHADKSGSGGEKIGVRPYREGDSLRLVHWGKTARLDQLVVCEQQSPSRDTVSVIADLNDDNPLLNECCLRAAASICNEFHSHGFTVNFDFGAQPSVIDPRNSSFRNLMDQLAALDLEELNSDTIQNSRDGTCFFVSALQGLANLKHLTKHSLKTVLIHGETEEDGNFKAWLNLDSNSELRTVLPKGWVKACQTNWQVSG